MYKYDWLIGRLKSPEFAEAREYVLRAALSLIEELPGVSPWRPASCPPEVPPGSKVPVVLSGDGGECTLGFYLRGYPTSDGPLTGFHIQVIWDDAECEEPFARFQYHYSEAPGHTHWAFVADLPCAK